MAFRSLNKKAIGCMRLSAFIGQGILALIFIAARVIISGTQVDIPLWADVLLALWGVYAVVYCIAAPYIRYHRYKYDIDEERIVVKEGLWFITKQFAPIERVQQISVARGPIDRIFGLGKVTATTAGGTVTIRFLEVEEAEKIVESLLGRIRSIVKEQDLRV
ncbi:MAG: PH domain-containing protein [Oscillospiraceae bacterium]|nr:PH domain-containing protein [Oscillospiraceae bacterium]MDD3833760.1 PH domain-containing protein [Oscillospiraceae bacterium]MDD4545841.1 PH domain-containing protein [Oscillospiraceae bacterium]